MPLPISLIDHSTKFAQLGERREVCKNRSLGIYSQAHEDCKNRSLGIYSPRVLDIRKKRDLPVQIGRLLGTMSHAETGALIILANSLRQIAISHDTAKDYLPLQLTEQVRLSEHNSVTHRYLAGLTPPTRSTHQVIASEVHDSSAMSRAAPCSLDNEVQELIRDAIVKPVDYFSWHDLAEFGIVRKNLDLHLLVNDFPDTFPTAVGEI